MQILSKFCHNKHLTRKMAPHTIEHCINDDTSFLRPYGSRVILNII